MLLKLYLVLCKGFACPRPLSCLFWKTCQDQSPRGHGCRSGSDPWNSHWCTREGKQWLARKLELFLLALYSPQSTKPFFSYGFDYKLRSNWGKVLDFVSLTHIWETTRYLRKVIYYWCIELAEFCSCLQNTRYMQFWSGCLQAYLLCRVTIPLLQADLKFAFSKWKAYGKLLLKFSKQTDCHSHCKLGLIKPSFVHLYNSVRNSLGSLSAEWTGNSKTWCGLIHARMET